MVSILSPQKPSGLGGAVGGLADAAGSVAGNIVKSVASTAINSLIGGAFPFPPDSAAYTLTIDGFGIMGAFTKIQGLNMELETETFSEGGENHHRHMVPKGLKWAPIVLYRTLAISSDIFRWMKEETGYDVETRDNKVKGRNMSITAFSRHAPWSGALPGALDLPKLGGIVDLGSLVDFNAPIRTWNFMNAVPIKWDGPRWDVSVWSVVGESLTIQHDGFVEGGIGGLTGGFIG